MATKNISEIIDNATEYYDYTADYLGLFSCNKGGDKSIYAYVCYDGHREVNKLAENVYDIDRGIGQMWAVSGITKEQEKWDSLPSWCQLIATDNNGHILYESSKRYF